MSQVVLQDITKVYPSGQVAIASASFEVAAGELVVMVGPSGCGKSTLLRMVAGLEEVTSGTLSIGGRVVNDVAAKDRDIAMVFQSYALYPHMTVAENLGFGLTLRGMDRQLVAQRVNEAAQMLELGAMLERRPSQLSGGQRQRVALGRALVRQPKVFLLDEPLSNLDAKLRSAMRSEIAKLHRELQATMLYVTHDQVEAMTLGQRIVVLNQGKIQQIDTPMALYERPATAFVAGFLGSPAINLVRGVLALSAAPVVRASGVDFPLAPQALSEIARELDGQEIVIGLRPEHLQYQRATASDLRAQGVLAVSGTCESVEQLGSEAFVTVRVGVMPLVARVAADGVPPIGQTITMTYDPQRLHFFRADSGTRLALRGEAL
jgi:multiple sugar transport system ATP-binding protein